MFLYTTKTWIAVIAAIFTTEVIWKKIKCNQKSKGDNGISGPRTVQIPMSTILTKLRPVLKSEFSTTEDYVP